MWSQAAGSSQAEVTPGRNPCPPIPVGKRVASCAFSLQPTWREGCVSPGGGRVVNVPWGDGGREVSHPVTAHVPEQLGGVGRRPSGG